MNADLRLGMVCGPPADAEAKGTNVVKSRDEALFWRPATIEER